MLHTKYSHRHVLSEDDKLNKRILSYPERQQGPNVTPMQGDEDDLRLHRLHCTAVAYVCCKLGDLRLAGRPGRRHRSLLLFHV